MVLLCGRNTAVARNYTAPTNNKKNYYLYYIDVYLNSLQ